MGPGWIVSSNLEKDVNVIGNFVFEFNLITFTSGVHLILFSNLMCNHLRGDGTFDLLLGLLRDLVLTYFAVLGLVRQSGAQGFLTSLEILEIQDSGKQRKIRPCLGILENLGILEMPPLKRPFL